MAARSNEQVPSGEGVAIEADERVCLHDEYQFFAVPGRWRRGEIAKDARTPFGGLDVLHAPRCPESFGHGGSRYSSVFSLSTPSSSFFSFPMVASLAPSFCLMSSPMVPPAASAAGVLLGIFDARAAGRASPADSVVGAASPVRIDRVIRRS